MDTVQYRPTITDLWRRLSRLQRKRRYLQWIEYMHGCCLRDVTRGGYECKCKQCIARIRTTRQLKGQIAEEMDELEILLRQTQTYIDAGLKHPGHRRPT